MGYGAPATDSTEEIPRGVRRAKVLITATLSPRDWPRDLGDYYSATLPGLLASSESELVKRILETTLLTIRSAFEANPDIRNFTLDEVVSSGGFGDDDRVLIANVVSIANLRWGGSGEGLGRGSRRTWGIPQDIEALAKCSSAADFLAMSRDSDAQHP